MDSKQLDALAQWEIKDLTAEKAVDWLTKTNHVSGHTALFGLANFIQRQAALIERQDRMIDKAVARISHREGTCPNDLFSWENECEKCPSDGEDFISHQCWRKWLEEEAGE